MLASLTWSRLSHELKLSQVRFVSSLLSKKQLKEMKERKLKENRRLSKLLPDQDEDLPTYQYYKGTNRNPVSRVFAWGNACYGALGNRELLIPPKPKQKALQTMHRPMRVSTLERTTVKDVACGYGYSVFACKYKDDAHFYGTGLNNQGQFGYHEQVAGKPLQTLIVPVPCKIPCLSEGGKISRVECGQSHTILLSDAGQIFSLGSNAFGQCGRPVIDDEDYFKSRLIHQVKIPIESNEDWITDIECGLNHTMFVSKQGQVFSCGWSADGQTGLGHYDNQETPSRVKGDIELEKIVKVACSGDCVLALNDKGDVFGWGNSEYHQFNMVTDEQQVNSPVKLNLGEVGKVIDIAAGGSICMVLNDQHDVFVWGFGILGQGPNVSNSNKPLLLPPTLFGRNEWNPEVITEKIFCGLHTNAAINSNGDLFTWGKNRGRCLGLGDEKDQFFPLKVHMGGEVTKVSLGVDHCLALCKPYL